MIDKSELIKICNEYGIDYKNLIKNNSNVLKYGEEDNIIYILDFLKDKLNIDSKNIEKCPSILYFQIENVKDNYIFLKEKEINIKDVETCLHV